MSKKKGEGLKSFNRGFNVPDTYIIIFFVVVIAAVMTFLVPKGYYETEDVTYLMNGVEKTRTVIKDGSFQYLTDAAGKPVTEGVALFSGDGGTGFFNYMYNYFVLNDLQLITIYSLIFIIAPFLYCTIKITTAKTKTEFHHISTVLKWIVFFGIFILPILNHNIQQNA